MDLRQNSFVRFTIIVVFFLCVSKVFSQEDFIKEAEKYIENNEFNKAVETYELALEKFPENIDIKKRLAQLYSWTKDYKNAIKLYESVLLKYPEDYDIKFQMGLVLSWRSEFNEAIEIFKEILEAVPDYLDVQISLGRTLLWKKDYDASIEVLEESYRGNPDNEEILKILTRVYIEKGEYVQAKSYNNELLRINPASPDGLKNSRFFKIFTLEAGYVYDDLSQYDDWHENRLSILYQPSRKKTVYFGGSTFKRFGKNDNQIYGNFLYGLSKKMDINISASLGFNHNFIPKQKIGADLFYKLGLYYVLDIGFQYLNFKEDKIKLYRVGFDYYPIMLKNFNIDYKYYHSTGIQNIQSSTHLIRIHYVKEKEFYFSAGFASGGEAYHFIGMQELSEFKSNSLIINLTYWLKSSIGVRLLYTFTGRSSSYNRSTFGGNFLFSF